MNRIVLLILFTLFFCCEKASEKDLTNNNSKEKSINKHYIIAKNINNTLNIRYEAINKCFNLAKDYKHDTLFSKVLYLKNVIHLSLEQFDSLFQFSSDLENHAKRINDHFYLGKINYLKGYYYDDIANLPDSAFYYYNHSKNNFIKTGDSIETGRKLLNIAILQNIQNDFFGAKETLTEALQYLNSSNDNKYIASIHNELATNNLELLNYSDAIKYYKKAINITNLKNDIISYKNNLATAYTENEMYDDSIAILTEILSDSLVKKGSIRYARILHNLSYAKWRNGIPNQITHFFKALEIRKKENDKRGLIASYRDLGEYFLKRNSYGTKKYLDTVIQLSKKLKIPTAETDALKLLMVLEPKNIAFKDRHIFLKDSLYKQELKAKTQFAKMKYDDKLKQEVITNLTLEKEIKTLEVVTQKNQKTVSILLGIITILSGLFFVYYLKQRHKKDKLNEIYITETRISQKVHDELANDVYNVMNRIQNKTEIQQNDVLDQLENIYQRTRDIAYENGIISPDNSAYYLELKDMLNAYQNETVKISTIGINKDFLEPIKTYKKIVIERVLKELMTNMKKHSHASNVIISFKKEKQNILITYVDDGVGFKKIEHFKNNGLQNAENRIKDINGSFNFDLNREKGIAINISFPV